MILRWILAFLAFGLAPSAQALTFTPQGASKRVTQVRVHFESDVSRIGESQSPFQVDCEAKGQGRWVTSQDWVYDFPSELPAGLSCRFQRTLKKDLQGQTISGQDFYSFHTGGPSVLDIEPNPEYALIDEDQIFVMKVDSALKESTLAGRLFFEIPQIANPVAAKILSLAEVKKANPSFARIYKDHKPLPLFVMASSRFPSAKTISLIWDKGIESVNGVPNAARQSFRFKTREAFLSRESCPKASKGSACSPTGDIVIRFTAPLAEQAKFKIEGLGADQEDSKKRR